MAIFEQIIFMPINIIIINNVIILRRGVSVSLVLKFATSARTACEEKNSQIWRI